MVRLLEGAGAVALPLPAPVPVPAPAPAPPRPPGPAPEGTGRQLWEAASRGQVDQVQALCERWGGHGEVISWAHPIFGLTPLHKAYRSPQCTAILLSTPGCDVNKGTNDGQTPLWLAAYYGFPETVQALLAAPGIDINKAPTGGEEECIGKSPLIIAREGAARGRGGCQEVVRLLEGHVRERGLRLPEGGAGAGGAVAGGGSA